MQKKQKQKKTALAKQLEIQQNLSTAFHPQTDRLSGWKNQWIKQYLCIVTAQYPQDWTTWLMLATAIYNNQQNTTTGLSPAQILLGIELILSPKANHQTDNQFTKD